MFGSATSPHHHTESHHVKIPGPYKYRRPLQQATVSDTINTNMNSRVASASDLAFLNQPYRPVYSPFAAAKPVLVHQYALLFNVHSKSRDLGS